MTKYNDPNGRCGCLNSPFRQQSSALGLKMSACFDGNCSAPNVYIDKSLRNVSTSKAACQGTCSNMQLCFSDTCIQNQQNIKSVCPSYSAEKYVYINNTCEKCNSTGNCNDDSKTYSSLSECTDSHPGPTPKPTPNPNKPGPLPSLPPARPTTPYKKQLIDAWYDVAGAIWPIAILVLLAIMILLI